MLSVVVRWSAEMTDVRCPCGSVVYSTKRKSSLGFCGGQAVAVAKLHSACQQRWSTEQLPLVPTKQALVYGKWESGCCD